MNTPYPVIGARAEMEFDWNNWSRPFFKVLALLIACCIFFLFRQQFQDFGSVFTKVQNWLIGGTIALLVGITFYYS
jgi:hypothetical protein